MVFVLVKCTAPFTNLVSNNFSVIIVNFEALFLKRAKSTK